MSRPGPDEFGPFFGGYVSHVPETDILPILTTSLDDALAILRPVSEAEGGVLHAPYTWSIKEVVGHLTDTERVMGYRALRFARGDATPLPGFEENDYAREGAFNRITLAELVAEFEAVRRSNIAFFRHLPADAWKRSGIANNNRLTVHALAYIIVGHGRHHMAIVRRRMGG